MFIKKAHQTMGQTARTRTHFNSAIVITGLEQLEFIANLLLIFNPNFIIIFVVISYPKINVKKGKEVSLKIFFKN